MPSEKEPEFAVVGRTLVMRAGEQTVCIGRTNISVVTSAPSDRVPGSWATVSALIMFQGGAIRFDGATVRQVAHAWHCALDMIADNKSGAIATIDAGTPRRATDGGGLVLGS